MAHDLVVKNGKIVYPWGIVEGDIAVNDGRISVIYEKGSTYDAKETVDASGLHVLPGLIDTHVHIGWPDWPFEEDLGPTTKAAAAGGVTTVLNYVMAPESLVKGIEEQKHKFERGSYVDGCFHGMIFSEKNIEEIPEAAQMGVRSFKFFLPYRGSEAVPPAVGIDDGILYTGFKKIAELNPKGRALCHCENIEVFFKLKDEFLKQHREDIDWHDTRPNFSEVESIRRVAFFAKETGCPVYIVHMSVKEGPEEIRRARAEGVDITGETCPQYLTLTKRADRILSKVNPPLRDTEDNESLWQGLNDGTLSCLGSDHAPCAKKHKTEFWSAVVGFAGVQTMLPAVLSEGVNKGRLTLEKLAEITLNNARTFGLHPRKGVLSVGADADLTIVDLNKTVQIKAQNLYHISDFTPFEDMSLKGNAVLTMVRGQVVAKEGKIVGRPTGKFIPAYQQELGL
ncbi:dihydroorotase [Paradesulfitobacterium ferrireducens]|uniref:dihydroorotase n=1 Tax=Paradesulfitobacterium ferrireducens TaxID=2816476 RepID=UPI001A8CDE70|nr:amidohydrolase family protein [Paradesulfitobacterium ferrireducens]